MQCRGSKDAWLPLVSLLWMALLPQARPTAAQLTEVRALSAEPDFRQVSLHWLYPRRAPDLFAFRVDYCELQEWGVNRCRTKMVDAPPRPPFTGGQPGGVDEDLSEYGALVTGLRMATNYTFSVSPVEGRLQQLQQLGRNRHARTIMAPTKGFSARATLCLPDVSEVEVHTGPHFSGRIAVEAGEAQGAAAEAWRRGGLGAGPAGPGDGAHEPCAVAGDAASPQESYTLRIDHQRCGSHVNRSTVATFILVQENLPILTHSTRRFLVLCTFQPDALIVRAGISLPTVHGEHRDREELGEPAHGNQLGGGGGRPAEVMAFQLQDEDDAVAVAMSRQVELGATQARTQDMPRGAAEEGEAQLVLTSVLLVSGVIACAITAWWFAPRRRSTSRSVLSDDSMSTVSAYQNYENSLRDSDSCSSSILGSVSSSLWRYPADSGKAGLDLVLEDEFGESADPRNRAYEDKPSLVFAIRLPDVSTAGAAGHGHETASECSVAIGEPTSLAQSDA